MSPSPVPDYGAVLADVRKVRRAGLLRLRGLELPVLDRVEREARERGGESPNGGIEQLLRRAVSRLGGGTLQESAEYTLGLAHGTRDWPASDRRKRAAQVYGVSPDRFRKHHERMVLGQVVEQLIALATQPVPAGAGPGTLPVVHTIRHVSTGGRTVPVTVHAHPVDQLRDIDVVVSSTNTYLELPADFKSSVSASLRRTGALRDSSGALVEDRIGDEVRQWAVRHRVTGRMVAPGTVVPTSPGALEQQGIRRLYHAAVAVPRPGTNDYDVQPADITRSVTRIFGLLAEERRRFSPPLRSVCFPLIGAGRGGLEPLHSFGAVWAAVEAEVARGGNWELHVVTRRAVRADLVVRLLTSLGTGTGAGSRAGKAAAAGSGAGEGG